MATMAKARFQVDAPPETRRAVKVEAIKAGINPSQMATICMDYVTGLMQNGRTPKPVHDAIEKVRVEKAKREAEKKDDE